jgi:hypothetical protein
MQFTYTALIWTAFVLKFKRTMHAIPYTGLMACWSACNLAAIQQRALGGRPKAFLFSRDNRQLFSWDWKQYKRWAKADIIRSCHNFVLRSEQAALRTIDRIKSKRHLHPRKVLLRGKWHCNIYNLPTTWPFHSILFALSFVECADFILKQITGSCGAVGALLQRYGSRSSMDTMTCQRELHKCQPQCTFPRSNLKATTFLGLIIPLWRFTSKSVRNIPLLHDVSRTIWGTALACIRRFALKVCTNRLHQVNTTTWICAADAACFQRSLSKVCTKHNAFM